MVKRVKQDYGRSDTLLSTIRIIDAEKTALDALLVVHSLGHFSCFLVTELTKANATAHSRTGIPF